MSTTFLLPLDVWFSWSVKGSLIILIALTAVRLLRRAPAAARHLVLVTALPALLLLPLVRSIVHENPHAVPFVVPIARTSNVVLLPLTNEFTHEVAPVATPNERAHPPAPTKIAWRTWVSSLLTLGAMLAVLRLMIGVASAAAVRGRSARVDDAAWLALLAAERKRLTISRAVLLRLSDEVDLPATLGALRPVILLPGDCHQWREGIRRQVLIHELAHIERNDFVTQFLAQLSLALFWFNPLVHVAVRKMRAEAENACDDAVLRAGVRPSAYANTLIELNAAPIGLPRFVAVAMGGPPRLEDRVRAIVSASRDSSQGRVLFAAAIVALLGIVMPLTAIERQASGKSTPLQTAAASREELDCRPVYVKNAPFRETSGRLTLDDGTSSYYFFRRPGPDRCLEASFSLDARFADDDRDVTVTPRLHALVREKRADADRMAVITESGGELRRAFQVNGHDEPWSSGETWYRSVMPDVIRLSSAGITARAQRLLDHSGLAGLSAELPHLGDDGVREQYLAALLVLRSPAELPREELIETGQTALRGFEPSMARLLSEIVTREGSDASIRGAVLAAAAKLTDGADRNTVLEAMAQNRDAEVRRSALAAIDLLPGEVWHRLFLDRASAAYLTGEPSLIEPYFQAVERIDGSRDRAMLLEALLTRNPSPTVIQRIAAAAKDIRDPDDRAEVEAAIARAI